MTLRVCICCGEPMADRGHALSRNPNLCASCSSLADGMEEPSISNLPEGEAAPAETPEETEYLGEHHTVVE
jgi:hypothetical protein